MHSIRLFTQTEPNLKDDEQATSLYDVDEVQDASCSTIHADYTLDEVDEREYLPLLVKKLRHGGELHISGVDLGEVSRYFTFGHLQEVEVKELIMNKNLSTINFVLSILQGLKLKIMTKRINNMTYYIKAVRE